MRTHLVLLGVVLGVALRWRDARRLTARGFAKSEVRRILNPHGGRPPINWWIIGGGLAFATVLTAPTGNPDTLAGSGAPGAQLAALAEIGAGPVRGLGTIGIAGTTEDVRFRGLEIGPVEPISRVWPFVASTLGAAWASLGRPDQAVRLLEQAVERALAMKLMANHPLRLVRLGEAAGLLLGEEQPSVQHHVELPTRARRRGRVDSGSVADLGRETRGPCVVARSGRAVEDLDRHGGED